MLANAFLYLVHLLLGFIVTLLPAGTAAANSSVVSAVATVDGIFHALSDFFPNAAIFGSTAALFVFELAYGAYKVIRWGYQKIPGIN